MEGFIKIQRKILEWEWYSDTNTFKVFLHLLLTANYKESKWRGETINPGQLLTGRKQLSQQTGLSEQQIRTALNKLEGTGEITSKITNKYSILTLNNWSSYNQQDNKRVTNNQPTSNQQVTTSNKYNNINKDIFTEFINNPENESATFYLIKNFLLLGWKPAKEETIETIRNWMKEVFEENEVSESGVMKRSIDIWYEYWKEEKRPKNVKSTFRSTIKFSIPGKKQ